MALLKWGNGSLTILTINKLVRSYIFRGLYWEKERGQNKQKNEKKVPVFLARLRQSI